MDLGAPGTDVMSSVPTGKNSNRPQSGYALKSGTSSERWCCCHWLPPPLLLPLAAGCGVVPVLWWWWR